MDTTGPRCFVTGPGSKTALVQAGVPSACIDAPDQTAAQFDSEALWQVVQAQVQPGWRVLIVRGNTGESDGAEEATPSQGAGRHWFAARLTERGAEVEFLVAYARRAPQLAANALALLQVAAGDGTVWLFSPIGEPLARVRSCTGIRTTNCTYDGDNLYITEAEEAAILVARMPTPGRPMFSHR